MGVTILLRLDCHTQTIDQDELELFMAWMRGLGIEPNHVRATAIESPDGKLSNRYLLHLAEFQQSERGVALDFATDAPKLLYRTVELDGWTWPDVRALERERVR